MNQPYIGVIPGQIKDGDDTRTNLLEVLGIRNLTPMSIGGYNDGYNTPPVAAVEIDGRQYSLKAILARVAAGSGGGGSVTAESIRDALGYTPGRDYTPWTLIHEKVIGEDEADISTFKYLDDRIKTAKEVFVSFVMPEALASNASVCPSFLSNSQTIIGNWTNLKSGCKYFYMYLHNDAAMSRYMEYCNMSSENLAVLVAKYFDGVYHSQKNKSAINNIKYVFVSENTYFPVGTVIQVYIRGEWDNANL